MKTWFKCQTVAAAKPEDGEVCEISIYDEIGGFGVTAGDFINAVKASPAPVISLRINSPGGSVFDGLAIYNYLRSQKDRTVIARVDGIAASMASVIACAASRLTVPANAYLMIHNPMGGCAWDATAEDMRKTADLLDQFGDTIADIYARRSGKSAEECSAMMDAETWMDGRAALAAGFCDEVDEDSIDMAACADVSRYSKRPDALKAKDAAAVETPPPETPAAPVVPPEDKPAASEDQTVFVPPDMGQLLNAQVGNEFYAAYRYYAIAAACEAKGLAGIAGYFRKQGGDEIGHAMTVYAYLVSTGANIALPPISAPVVDSSVDLLAITRAVLDQEMSVTADWQAIAKLAKEQDNAATQKLAQEFMAEQVEEENAALTLHQRVKLADTGSGILTIDADLRARAEHAAAEAKAKAHADIEATIAPTIRATVEAEITAKAHAEAEAKRNPRAEAKAMIDICGKEKGAAYFAEGKTLEQAKDALIDSQKAEIGRLKAENADQAQRLGVKAKCPAVPFEPEAPAARSTMRVSEADFEAYAKARGLAGKDKETLRAKMCERIEKPTKTEGDEDDE